MADTARVENLATHRALYLQSVLPLALQFGTSEVEPESEPLKASRLVYHLRMFTPLTGRITGHRQWRGAYAPSWFRYRVLLTSFRWLCRDGFRRAVPWLASQVLESVPLP